MASITIIAIALEWALIYTSVNVSSSSGSTIFVTDVAVRILSGST